MIALEIVGVLFLLLGYYYLNKKDILGPCFTVFGCICMIVIGLTNQIYFYALFNAICICINAPSIWKGRIE